MDGVRSNRRAIKARLMRLCESEVSTRTFRIASPFLQRPRMLSPFSFVPSFAESNVPSLLVRRERKKSQTVSLDCG